MTPSGGVEERVSYMGGVQGTLQMMIDYMMMLYTSLSSLNCLANNLKAWMVGWSFLDGSSHTRLRSCPARLQR